MAAALALIVLLALFSRLLPDIIGISDPTSKGPRLRYPLGYWNADGAAFGFAVVFILWTSLRGSFAAMRWVAVGVLPAAFLAIYFTYSRGGLLAAVVGTVLFLFLSRDRLRHLALLVIAGLGVLPAMIVASDKQAIGDGLTNSAGVDQGIEVLLILLAGTAFVLLANFGLNLLGARRGPAATRVLEASRDTRVLKGIALSGAVVAILLAVIFGGRAWDRFTDPAVRFPDSPQSHFTELYGAGRYEFWRVAVEDFKENPVGGSGAGTYEFAWQKDRNIDIAIQDAHSLYFENLAELGIPGLLVVLVLVGGFLWFGFGAWRAAEGRDRELYGALLAVMGAFALAAAFDWFWEIAALGAVFFLAGGVLIGVRCQQLAVASPGGPDPDRGGGRYSLAIAGLAVAWLSAAVLVGPLLVQRELDASRDAVAAANIPDAVDHAETARSIEPWAASPYLQLGLLAEVQGDLALADDRLTSAIDREDQNWQLWFLRSRVRSEAGDDAGAASDLAKARELDPKAVELQAAALPDTASPQDEGE